VTAADPLLAHDLAAVEHGRGDGAVGPVAVARRAEPGLDLGQVVGRGDDHPLLHQFRRVDVHPQQRAQRSRVPTLVHGRVVELLVELFGENPETDLHPPHGRARMIAINPRGRPAHAILDELVVGLPVQRERGPHGDPYVAGQALG
jgi:hypothetical protein